MIDVEADNIAIGIEIDDEARDDLPRLCSWRALELDTETVGLRIIMQLSSSSRSSAGALGILADGGNVVGIGAALEHA